MQTAKGRATPKESPTKVSPRPIRPLKVNPVEQSSLSLSPSSNATARILKDKSPKVADRRSPRSLVCEKRPSKLSELESQISKLQNDLKTIKDQLVASESSKKEAQADAEDVKRQLADVCLKLEVSQKQLSELDASKNPTLINSQDISQEDDIASLNLALDEIKSLQQRREVSKLWGEHDNATHAEFQSFTNNFAETSALVESMRHELEKTKVSEAQARNQVIETLLQLEAAKDTINALRSDAVNSSEAYKSIVSQLQQSRAKVSFLESFVNNVKKVNPDDLSESKNHVTCDVKELQLELLATKSEVRQLRSALEVSEIRLDEERFQNSQQIESSAERLDQSKALSSLKEADNSVVSELQQSRAQVSFLESYVNNLKKVDSTGNQKSSERELKKERSSDINELPMELQAAMSEVRQLKSALEASEKRFNDELSHSSLREAELAEALKQANAKVDELKASLIDKETELQCISEENERLNTMFDKSESSHVDQEMEAEVAKLKEQVAELNARLMDKETALQNVLDEDETVKLEISKQEMDESTWATELETARAAEVEAMTKLGYMSEDMDKSNKMVARINEQLEAAQATNADMEAELRRIKVQSDQWRKAAEAAASMLSPGNDKYMERTGSTPLEGKYSPVGGTMGSPYLDEYDDDSNKKKNGNVLKKIGVLWKKPHK